MSTLGDRMKGYEAVSAGRLMPKAPVLIRLDGKAFHTLTRGLDKPFDATFQGSMWKTAAYLCEEVSGCRLAYVQSDEITLLLVDYQSQQTQGWFGYEVQKVCSVSAGMASGFFTSQYRKLAAFDARCWNLPAHEVTNCFIWRQQDATRNSVSGLAQAHFSAKQLHGKGGAEMQDMLIAKGINWNDIPTPQKRGVCIVRETYQLGEAVRHRWTTDLHIPVFTECREYVERFVRPEPVVLESREAGR